MVRGWQGTSNEHFRTLALISGRTRTIDSDSQTLDFDSGPVLTVYEGDLLQVTVIDEDVLKHDLIGRHALAATRQILERGSVDLGPAGSIRSLELHFAPSSR